MDLKELRTPLPWFKGCMAFRVRGLRTFGVKLYEGVS